MEHKQNTFTEDGKAVERTSPDAKFVSNAVFVTGIILSSVLLAFTVLDMSGVLELPRLLHTYFNPVLLLGCCALYFALAYVNWTNYFWRRDTEQKHSLFWPILTTIVFVVGGIYVIWSWN